MDEIWKDVPGYEGLYQASTLGCIKSLNYNKTGIEMILRPGVNLSGYHKVTLHKKGKQKSFYVHRLVMLTFEGISKMDVDHINEIKTDNRFENLRYLDERTNVSRSIRNKTSKHTGVSLHKKNRKWISQIRINGKVVYLGSFSKEEDAYIAYKNRMSKI